MTNRSEFLKLLQTNDKDKLKEWLVNNSKQPKPIAAVMFEKKTKEEVEDIDSI